MDFNFDQIKDGYIATLKNYKDFNGRARRQEFWTFWACNVVISFALQLVFKILGMGLLGSLVGFAFSLVIIVPSIAVGVRRLHDTNRTGKLMLLFLACCVGGIPVLYWCTLEGDRGDNQYGSDPKAVAPQADDTAPTA